MDWIHIDLDPRPYDATLLRRKDAERFEKLTEDERIEAWLEMEREDIREALVDPPEKVPRPTWVVFSGGGYQAGWRLDTPMVFSGDSIRLREQGERHVASLLPHFPDWADMKAINIDRILRLPGTVNWPNAAKRKKGRRASVSRAVSFNDSTHTIGAFPAANMANVAATFRADDIEIGGAIEIDGINDPRLDRLDAETKTLIETGGIPGQTQPDARSGWLWRAVNSMVRKGLSNELIYSIIVNPDFGISESVLEYKDVERYAKRQVARAREAAVDPRIKSMNKKHAVVVIGGKTRVVTPKNRDGRAEYVFQTFEDLSKYYRGDNVMVEKELKDGKVKVPKNRGDFWLDHPCHDKYEDFGFYPNGTDPTVYNTWRGFAFEPKEGDCSLYLKHMRDNICNGASDVYEYLLSWMANAVQNPHINGRVAVALLGNRGTGKTLFVEKFGALFGRHYYSASDPKRFTAQFNSALADCVVCLMDEVKWQGRAADQGILKSLITGDRMPVEYKGVDSITAPNYLHIFMTENNEDFIDAGMHERRYLVVRVSDNSMQDFDYFNKIIQQMDTGGYEALLHLLLTRDISDWSVWNMPKTETLRQQQEQNLDIYQSWWLASLRAGEFRGRAWVERT